MSNELKVVLFPVLLIAFGVAVHAVPTLVNLRRAIRASGLSEKQAAPTGMDASRWSRMLNGVGKDQLHVEHVEQMPLIVRQYLHLFELVRLGIPVEIRKSLKVARAVRELKRSA